MGGTSKSVIPAALIPLGDRVSSWLLLFLQLTPALGSPWGAELVGVLLEASL